MKQAKLFITIAATAALGLTSCLSGLSKVSDEANEIAAGKCFTVKEGTVTYESGDIVTFKEYGKEWAQYNAETKTHVVVKGGVYYSIDETAKTYYQTNYGDAYSGCPYIFWESAYEWGDKWGGAELKKSHETIAGKKCTVFTTGSEKVGGWERILFLSTSSDGSSVLRAKSWSNSVTENYFSLDGYTLSSTY